MFVFFQDKLINHLVKDCLLKRSSQMLVGPFLHFYVRNAPSQCFLLQKLQVLTPTLQARLVRRDGHKLSLL